MKHGTAPAPEERLRLSRAPAAELAGAALRAQEAAGLEAADFVVIAVEPGQSDVAEAAARTALERATEQ